MKNYFLKTLVFFTLFLSLPALAQHSHEQGGEHSDETFIEMMQSLQTELDTLTRAVIIDNFEAAHDAAYAIATHAAPAPEELKRVMNVLGDKAESFGVCDKKAHDLAMQTAMAAHEKNGENLANQYTNLVKQVRLCHAEYRDLVRNAE